MIYRSGPPPGSSAISASNPERKHESCYYEIENGASESQISILNKTSGEEGSARIYIQVLKATDMNVFIYGGKSRFSATESIIPNNT